MWSALLLLSLYVVAQGQQQVHPLLEEFKAFKTRFAKSYFTVDEFEHRFEVFKTNWAMIHSHNANATASTGITLRINQFSDMTNEEFRTTMTSKLGRRQRCTEWVGTKGTNTNKAEFPSSVDWRELGGVSSVKNQGQCGSCWAFSSAGAIEGAMFRKTGILTDVSEQQLVDCSKRYGNMGCNGGMMDSAFEYVMNEGGLCSLSSYPYVSGTTQQPNSECQTCETVSATVSKCYEVKPNDEVVLMQAVFHTPVSVAIEADTFYFQSYGGGVLNDVKCGTNLDHGVLVVGYGTDTKLGDYWTVKNSWGEDWGEEGYIRIQRTSSKDSEGMCGIAMMASFPEA